MFIPTRLRRLLLLGCVCGLLSVSAGSGVVRSAPNDPCYYREGGYHEQGIQVSGTWFGVKGRNHVRNPYVFPGSAVVRSVWVHRGEPPDYVEIGWCKGLDCCLDPDPAPGVPPPCIGKPPHYFAVFQEAGEPPRGIIWGPADPFTTHKFSAVCRWGTHWRFFLDGQYKYEVNPTTFSFGVPGGQSEVHNTCESAYTRWWDLKYYTVWEEWLPWYDLEEGNPLSPNPNYHVQIISDTEFKVVHD